MNISITDLFDRYGGEAPPLRKADAASPEKIRRLTMEKIRCGSRPGPRPVRKALRIALIAAAAAAMLMAGAFAVGSYVTSESQALAVARRELQVWRDLGLITAEPALQSDNLKIWSEDGETYNLTGWTYKILNPIYGIRDWDGQYATCVYVDTLTGKIVNLSIQAMAGEDAEPVPGKSLVMPESDEEYYYYENFGDIFDPSLTVGAFCEKLADYWGFGGYAIARTEDAFYGADGDGPPADALLTACYLPYITVRFDGDQKGAARYIEVNDLPGGAYLMAGVRGHSLG